MIIREVNKKDVERIQKINSLALGYEYSIEKTKSQLNKVLDTSWNKIFVAVIDNQVVGYVHAAEYECTYMDSLKNIMALAVDSSYRELGVGKELMKAVENWAKETGSHGVRLVSGHNRTGAHTFYQRCGYQMRKEQKNFIKFFGKE